MAVVQLLIPPLPAHVRTARLVVAAAARRAGLDDELVDELRLALGEACGRAVLLHAEHAPGTPVEIKVRDDVTGLTVSVTDRGPAAGPSDLADVAEGLLDDSHDADGGGSSDGDIALALLRALVDEVEVEPDTSDGPGTAGTTVTMRWPLRVRLSPLPSTAAVEA